MMFGIGTADVRLHVNKFINMLGEDENGWGLSHKVRFYDLLRKLRKFHFIKTN